MSALEPPPGSHAARSNRFLRFWTTPTGIVIASAAVITAIVALIIVFNDIGSGQSENVAGPTRPRQVATTPGPTTALSRPSDDVLIERSRLTMKSPDDADLESGVVGSGISSVDLYLYCSGLQCLLNAMGSLMTSIDGPGDKSSCIAALTSRRDQALDLGQLRTGQTLCIQTEEGHVGALRIVNLPGPGSVEFIFSYTLWN